MRRNSDSSPQCFQSNPGTQGPAALEVRRDAAEGPGIIAQAVGAMEKAGDLTHLPVLLHGLISCLCHCLPTANTYSQHLHLHCTTLEKLRFSPRASLVGMCHRITD